MKEEMLFQQMQFIRDRTLAQLDVTTEALADELPNGFRNTIRWNLGHIFVSHEFLLHSFAGEEPKIPADYNELFQRNTSPAEWITAPPTLQELRNLLDDQTKRIVEVFSGRLSEEGENPFQMTETVKFTTIGEVLNFALWHEGLHQATINCIKRAAGVENLWELPNGTR
jgi:uncharacterized damage-inducible protein DinB